MTGYLDLEPRLCSWITTRNGLTGSLLISKTDAASP